MLQILVAFSSVNRPDKFEPRRRGRIEAKEFFHSFIGSRVFLLELLVEKAEVSR